MSRDRRRGRHTFRDMVEGEPSDTRVQEEFALLDALERALARGSAKKQNEIAKNLAAKEKEVRAAEAEQRDAMAAVVDRALRATGDAARVKKLVDAFEICALGQIIAHDDFHDDDTVDRAIEHKHRIVAALDAIGTGKRAALARLLKSPFAGVRASAGAHLLNANLLREQIVPLLQEIERDVIGSAGWTAFWALSPDDHGDWLIEEADASSNDFD
jgi:hypothetical protein